MTDIQSIMPDKKPSIPINITTSETIRYFELKIADDPDKANAMSVAISLTAIAHQAKAMGLGALSMHIAGLAHAAYNGDHVMSVSAPMGKDTSPCKICRNVYGLNETCRCVPKAIS